jgi:hypothetical protein
MFSCRFILVVIDRQQQPIERLIQEGQTGKLNIKLGKNFELSMPITYSLNTKIEPLPESTQ